MSGWEVVAEVCGVTIVIASASMWLQRSLLRRDSRKWQAKVNAEAKRRRADR